MTGPCPPSLRELSCGSPATTIRCGAGLAERLVEFTESRTGAIAGRFEPGGEWIDITGDVIVIERAAVFASMHGGGR